jgi:hypothetical protein
VATVRERRDGVWEVRVFTGRDAQGRPTQVSRTVRGGKRDAQRVAEAFAERVRDADVGRAGRRRESWGGSTQSDEDESPLDARRLVRGSHVQQRRTCSRV